MQEPEYITPRESVLMEYEERQSDKQIAYGTKLKELEIETLKIETKWYAVLRLPFLIIKLPVVMIASLFIGITFVVHAIRKTTPDDRFWEFLGNYIKLK